MSEVVKVVGPHIAVQSEAAADDLESDAESEEGAQVSALPYMHVPLNQFNKELSRGGTSLGILRSVKTAGGARVLKLVVVIDGELTRSVSQW
jgi:tetrahydromethanopterin S-methyltransferase subunit E